MTRRAAIWTMVRNEDFLLRLWVSYYGRFVPRGQLFILVDGMDSTVPEGLDGCQVVTLPTVTAGPGFDAARWAFLSRFAAALTARFDVVIGGDVDELVVLDPAVGTDPVAHILEATEAPVISPFAIEIVHRTDLEPPLDPDRPILGQRAYGRLNASYCKPCILRTPVTWSLGGHYSDHPDLALSETLYLFHLRYLDRDMLLDRQRARFERVGGAEDVAGAGWSMSPESMEAFLQSFVDRGPPEETDFRFEWQRERIRRSWHHDPETGLWRHDRLHNRRSYRIPERFAGLV